MKSHLHVKRFVFTLFFCALAIFSVISMVSATCPPQMLTATFAWGQGGSESKSATWTQPSSCSGSYKILTYVYISGYYVVWVHDNTQGQDVLTPWNFSTTYGCDQAAFAPSVTLTSGHSYTMTVDRVDGGGPQLTTYADARIFAQCQGN